MEGVTRRSICLSAKLVWNQKLFRRTMKGIRSIPTKDELLVILPIFRDEIGHYGFSTTKHFIRDRFWWAGMQGDIYRYFRNSEGCQITEPILKYQTTLHVPLTTLFDVVSIDSAGPFNETSAVDKRLLIGV